MYINGQSVVFLKLHLELIFKLYYIRLNSKNQDNEMFIHYIILIKNLTTSN